MSSIPAPLACSLLLLLPVTPGCAARAAALAGGAPPATLDEPVARPPRALDGEGAHYVLGTDPTHPRVRYADGQLARNESCAIQLGNKLSRRIPPLYVNGQPIGFC